jgi:DUF4097 and DUF4098 domain-containing protein YvlB
MKRGIRVRVLALGTVAVATFSLCVGAAKAVADEGDISKVNESVHVDNGEHTGDVSTVNGSIHIGTGAVVKRVHTVNGGVSLESRVSADRVDSVNGAIHLGDGTQVHGQVHTTNGGIHAGDNSDIAGDITTMNGGIHIRSGHVGGSIETHAGGIDLGPNAHIDGNIKVDQDHNSWNFGFSKPPEIIIRPGTVVKGTLHFEREVRLYVSDRATIGAVTGAEVHKFSGDNPPD